MPENQDPPFEGACTCGAAHYRMTSNPLFVHCCHCRWCQRETGSAFVINALIESHHVKVTKGRVQTVHTPSESGKGQDIVRCPECRVALWSHYDGLGDKMSFVRVGTLDEPNLLPPDIHIYTSSKQPWVTLTGGTPAVPHYYDLKLHWSEESQARLDALIN